MSKTRAHDTAMKFDDQDDEQIFTAKRMVLADLDEMGDIEFLEQTASDIAASFMKVCVETSHEQLTDIISVHEAEIQLDEMGIGEEQERVDMVSVVRACHNNFSTGMAVLAYYLQIFETIKEDYEF
jgi:hypothetical protein